MPNITFTFDEIKTIDFYDGDVRAVAESGARPYLIIAAAILQWPNRIYVIVELEEATTKKFLSIFDEDGSKAERWDRFTAAFDNYVENYNGRAYMFSGFLKAGQSYEAKSLNTALVKKFVGYEVDDAFDPKKIKFWSKFNLV